MKKGIITEQVSITPKMAAEWLTTMRTNRFLSPTRIDCMARDMADNAWLGTNASIGFIGDFKELIDGQHRLHAIVKHDKPVTMLVTRNLDENVKAAIDQGKSRTLADQAAILGLNLNRGAIAIARRMMLGYIGGFKSYSRHEVFEFCGIARPSLDFVANLPKSNEAGFRQAGVLAPMARAYYTVEHDKLSRFAEVMSGSRRAEDDSEHVATMLSRLILSTIGSLMGGGSRSQTMIYRKTSWALVQYLEGNQTTKLFSSKCECFPIPFWDDDKQEVVASRVVRKPA